MSRIGKNPVAVPDGVSVNIVGPLVTAKGKLGELSAQLTDDVEVTQEDKIEDIAKAGHLNTLESLATGTDEIHEAEEKEDK